MLLLFSTLLTKAGLATSSLTSGEPSIVLSYPTTTLYSWPTLTAVPLRPTFVLLPSQGPLATSVPLTANPTERVPSLSEIHNTLPILLPLADPPAPSVLLGAKLDSGVPQFLRTKTFNASPPLPIVGIQVDPILNTANHPPHSEHLKAATPAVDLPLFLRFLPRLGAQRRFPRYLHHPRHHSLPLLLLIQSLSHQHHKPPLLHHPIPILRLSSKYLLPLLAMNVGNVLSKPVPPKASTPPSLGRKAKMPILSTCEVHMLSWTFTA